MAYYSGRVASYQELLSVLVAACVENGWVWSDDILSKYNLHIKALASDASNYSGISIQGGTGKASGNLVNPSYSKPRLGRLGEGNNSPAVKFPCQYNIHIFNNPDEVYCVICFDINKYHYLCFGKSNIDLTKTSGTGLWLSATATVNWSTGTILNGFVVREDGTGGGSTADPYAFVSGGPFYNSWDTIQFKDAAANTIHTGLGGDAWAGSYATLNGNISASLNLAPLLRIEPSIWSNESVLLPINIIQQADSSKLKIVAEISNARYIRINNIEPEQIITLGSDKWKVYPFFKKNIESPNNSVPLYNHTGTFGWAIRYDGP